MRDRGVHAVSRRFFNLQSVTLVIRAPFGANFTDKRRELKIHRTVQKESVEIHLGPVRDRAQTLWDLESRRPLHGTARGKVHHPVQRGPRRDS